MNSEFVKIPLVRNLSSDAKDIVGCVELREEDARLLAEFMSSGIDVQLSATLVRLSTGLQFMNMSFALSGAKAKTEDYIPLAPSVGLPPCPECSGDIDFDSNGVTGVCWRCGILWEKPGSNRRPRRILSRNPLKRNVSVELNDALNLIGEYCSQNLMDRWTFSIHCDNDEMRVELTDPEGNDRDDWQVEPISPVVDACDFSQQIEAEGT